MTEENKETLDAAVQDDDSVSTDNNDTLNKDSEGKDFEKLYENQKARAEKAEGKLKDVKSSVSEEPVVKEEKEEVKTGLSREEAILFAQGLTEEEVLKAGKIAELEGISLSEATKDELFVTWKEKKEKEAKSAKAQLGTSTGSPAVAEKKDFNSPNLDRDDHKALFDKAHGK